MATPSSSMQNPELPEQEEERKWTTSTVRSMKHQGIRRCRPPPHTGDRGAAFLCSWLPDHPELHPASCSDEPRHSRNGICIPEKDVTYEEVKAVYDKYYANEQFVRVLDKDVCPQTKWVEGSNYVDVNFKIDPRTKRIIMMGAMDNLVKGAAGQAVQNMNLMFGLPETKACACRRCSRKKTEADNRRNLRKVRIKE